MCLISFSSVQYHTKFNLNSRAENIIQQCNKDFEKQQHLICMFVYLLMIYESVIYKSFPWKFLEKKNIFLGKTGFLKSKQYTVSITSLFNY